MKKLRFLPRLRSLLLFANFTTLLLPIAGIILLHLYESELVRQTESALIGQGALVSAAFRQEILANSSANGIYLSSKPIAEQSLFSSEDGFTPIRPLLDVARSTILPTAPEASQPDSPADLLSKRAGKKIEPILREAQRITLAGIRLVDHQGVVVASTGSEMGLSLLNRQEVEKALHGQYASLLRQRISDEPPPAISSLSRRAWLRVFVALPIIEQGHVLGAVVLSRSPIGVGRGLYMIKDHLFKATLILLSLVIIVSLATTFAITRPIKALVHQADQVRKGIDDAARPLPNPGTAEVANLSESIAQMASSLSARAEYIKTFARHVSHEFKTPITSLKGTVEILQDHGLTMSIDEQLHFLSNMTKDIDNLDSMVRRMLELARADMARPGSASCDVKEVLAQLELKYNNEENEVLIAKLEDVPELKMDQEVLISILSNLIDNGLLHGGDDTQVSVTAQTINKDGIEFIISDNGSGITGANAEKIFRPFFTTARHSGGTGLGLTIVQSLLAAHDGAIELLTTKKGAAFRVVIG